MIELDRLAVLCAADAELRAHTLADLESALRDARLRPGAAAMTSTHYHHRPQGRKDATMSEQEKAGLTDEPEVEGHRAALNEDVPAKAKVKALEDDEGPEVEGHRVAFNPEDPLRKG